MWGAYGGGGCAAHLLQDRHPVVTDVDAHLGGLHQQEDAHPGQCRLEHDQGDATEDPCQLEPAEGKSVDCAESAFEATALATD